MHVCQWQVQVKKKKNVDAAEDKQPICSVAALLFYNGHMKKSIAINISSTN